MSASKSLIAWLRDFRPAHGLLMAAMLALASPTFAGKATLLDVAVMPLAPVVNVSVPTSLGFTIDIANKQTSGTATNVRFTATFPAGTSSVQVVSGDPDIAPPTCPISGSTLSCSFGKLAAGQFVPTFRIFFDTTTTGDVTFSTTTYYAEGEGPNAIKPNSSIDVNAVVKVKAVDADTATTIVPQRGGGSVVFKTDEKDKFSTKVDVPTSANAYALGFINEVLNEVVCNNFYECYDSNLDIKRADGLDFDPYLFITLMVRAENVKPGTLVGSLVLYYRPDNAVDFSPVLSCEVTTSYPCLLGDPIVTKVPGKGDNFTFNAISPFNGSYRLP